MVWEVNNTNRYLPEQPPAICIKMYQLHGPHRPIPPYAWLAAAFASFSRPTCCSDSSAVFAERRNRLKRRALAIQGKEHDQSHTPSQHVCIKSPKFCAPAAGGLPVRAYSVVRHRIWNGPRPVGAAAAHLKPRAQNRHRGGAVFTKHFKPRAKNRDRNGAVCAIHFNGK